ncbi:MAG: GNAT family N-acetyltransferase [Imperialibacter sp.]
MKNYAIVPLNTSHHKSEFYCGQPMLDNYLIKQAKQDAKRKLSVCFVLADNEGMVLGFYTLSSTSISQKLLPEEIRKKLPPNYKDLPATLLGRLVVDKKMAGRGFGELLLVDALKKSFDTASSSIGSMAVIVDPIDDNAVRFYQKYGFILLPDSGKMFLPMATISLLFDA